MHHIFITVMILSHDIALPCFKVKVEHTMAIDNDVDVDVNLTSSQEGVESKSSTHYSNRQ